MDASNSLHTNGEHHDNVGAADTDMPRRKQQTVPSQLPQEAGGKDVDAAASQQGAGDRPQFCERAPQDPGHDLEASGSGSRSSGSVFCECAHDVLCSAQV